MTFDARTAAMMAAGALILVSTFTFGHWWGQDSVLESDRLKAKSEVSYQIITIHNEAPTTELMLAAMTTCFDKSTGKDDCITKFLSQYGNTYMINLIDGTRELIAPNNISSRE